MLVINGRITDLLDVGHTCPTSVQIFWLMDLRSSLHKIKTLETKADVVISPS
jgi:hypothetical protein